MVFKLIRLICYRISEFENDVKEYGFQTRKRMSDAYKPFENDVKEYGFQTRRRGFSHDSTFENDVKEYGFQTKCFT